MITVERVVSCEGDVCSLWNAIGDTERLNRAVGNNAVDMKDLDDGSAARYLATTRLGGFTVQYEERPYEWVYLERFGVFRKMLSGPVKTLEAIYHFSKRPKGATEVRIEVNMEPRYGWLGPAVRISARQVINRLEREIKKIDVGIMAGQGAPSLAPSHPANEAALQGCLVALKGTAIAQKLVELVRGGSDLDVGRIRPFELAERWHMDGRELLTECLHAVRAGLFDLHWDIICPSCRTVSNSLPSLANLAEHGRCQLCEIDFGLDLDESVEVTFSPAPRIRKVDDRKYCIGGPARTPHVVAQAILPAGSDGILRAPEEGGRYRLFVRGGQVAPVTLREGAPLEARASVESSALIEMAPQGRLTLTNAGSERHVKLERLEWRSLAASARYLSTLPAFRREFPGDVLRPGTSLKVARVTILFTDLTDSTQLYTNIGDAAAFRLVQEHFDALVPLIEKNRGALVKTIGDAIMAVFSDEEGAVSAAMQMLDAFVGFRRDVPHGNATHIKIGLYSGPCFAINANGLLDYFGQSVNVAARLQGQAHSGEVVMEEASAHAAQQKGLLGAWSIKERSETTLKGVAGTMRIARVA